ncbi:hypothetical protein [Pricia sp.]|uniref:hypothetical protein n=1 Tax=Pricia sp. TaxID=2268138 RepID=UPI003593507B
MSDKVTSEGECIFCKKTFKKAGINRHLAKHLAERVVQGKREKSFHLKVEPNWSKNPYFLSLWIDGNTMMEALDYFLRAIWLECCGHMSAFRDIAKKPDYRFGGGFFDLMDAYELLDEGKVAEYERTMEANTGEIPKSRKAKDALFVNQKIEYEYDFGSTTELRITVMGEYGIKADDSIVLLSRNEPLEWKCETCNKAVAEEICSVCLGYEDEGMFCRKCAKKHSKECEDFADYAAMSAVNSPRMGVCGYDGGDIDKKRDGNLKVSS